MKKFFNDVFKEGKIVEKYKIWFLVPLVVFLIAVIAFTAFAVSGGSFSNGMNIGIDFSSGNILTVELKDNEANANFSAHEKIIRDIVSDAGGSVSYSQITGGSAIAVKYANFIKDTDEQKAVNDEIMLSVAAALDAYKASDDFVSIKSMGATASSNLITSSIICIVVAIALILIYVTIRFKFWSGIAAVAALVHDLIMVVCFTIIFHIQVNATFIAAIITILAYSINNTIVIFDRVRENTAINQNSNENKDIVGIVNLSVKQSLRRSINTTITTLFAIVILAIIGVSSIREFALPVIFGLICGAFSSLVLAPSVYCLIMNRLEKRKADRKPAAKAAKQVKQK